MPTHASQNHSFNQRVRTIHNSWTVNTAENAVADDSSQTRFRFKETGQQQRLAKYSLRYGPQFFFLATWRVDCFGHLSFTVFLRAKNQHGFIQIVAIASETKNSLKTFQSSAGMVV
jgi:hypothetical protein